MRKEFILVLTCLPFISIAQNVKSGSTKTEVAYGTYLNSAMKSPLNTLDTSSVSFHYDGQTVTYGIIVSVKTGRKWLDRNLGASRVATSLTDSLAFGDLFEWGRLADGHQLRTSEITINLSNADVPGNVDFIVPLSDPRDWRKPQNDHLWQDSSNINNPCPKGWRLPTKEEFEAEGITDMNGGFVQLKLVLAGYRSRLDGGLWGAGTQGFYWTSSPYNPQSASFILYANYTGKSHSDRGLGCSVRCIKNNH